MNSFSVVINSIQHIKSFRLEIDLDPSRLICLVGRNGAGKTTLFRALRNLSNADTFIKTASPQIFDAESRIDYRVDDYEVAFHYNKDLRSIDCKQIIPDDVRRAVVAELPIPHGARFNYFKNASKADADIRQAIAVGRYERPTELIEFLSTIYSTDRFQALVAVEAKGRLYYCIILADGRYIREDYLSSGEYFLINLYRTIKGKARLIAVDEIDLSLDAAAQAKLAGWLRKFCEEYQCTIIFTTHSLAIMRTLQKSELSYIDQEDGNVFFYPASYNYVKARLFGFSGWDKYILTEDLILVEFINHVIAQYCAGVLPKLRVRIIKVGSAGHVTNLLRRNLGEGFLSTSDNVIAVLDGDMRNVADAQHNDIHFIPVDSVEKAIQTHYNDADFPYKLPGARQFRNDKDLFKEIQTQGVASKPQLFDYICAKYDAPMKAFAETLSAFFTAAAGAGQPGGP